MDLPSEVPVMTLPNATLFPQALLPLHIFEPQYRRMLKDVLHSDRMFAVAARSLASLVTEEDLALGRIYPSLRRIQEVSTVLATAVAEVAFKDGLAGVDRPADVRKLVQETMWAPRYRAYV